MTIQIKLLTWFRNEGRDLPWRHTRNPYHILVSEIMLQQTQVDRVIPKYYAFLELFPNVETLAQASPADVIRAWQGLGYNRRAINLQRAAQALVEAGYPADQAAFPDTPEGLRALPGIGPYTSGAVACFAFEQDVVFLDTNIRRVIQRLFVGPEMTHLQPDAKLLEIAADMLPANQGWTWNQAVMELGALICTAQRPQCWRCPVQTMCAAYAIWSQADSQIELQPVRRPRRKVAEKPFHTTNRYYRGKVIDILRALAADQAITLADLGPQVQESWSHDQLPWLAKIVTGLADDGLVAWSENTHSDLAQWSVALPT